MRVATIIGLFLFVSVAQATAQSQTPPPVLAPNEVLAIPDFAGTGSEILAGIVQSDLSHSGIFREIRRGGTGPATDIGAVPDFAAWNAAGVRYLIVGAATDEPDGRMLVQFRLWDIANQSQLLGLQFKSARKGLRRISHLISDAVAKRATAHAGYFNTRIAFISEDRSGRTQLAVMDQDGASPIFLTTGKYRAAYPSFFPGGQMLAYTSERDGHAQAFLFSLESGKQKPIGNLPMPTRMPAFSRDGRTIALICEANGHADICLVETTTDRLIRTLAHNATDAFPSFSPAGTDLVFESDIGGEKGVFIADIAGAHFRKLGAGQVGTPVWSPDGAKIAVTRFTQDGSRIAVMDAEGSHLHEISTGSQDSRPAWAANSQALLFTRTVSLSHQLWAVDIDGDNERLIPTPAGATDASWSDPIN